MHIQRLRPWLATAIVTLATALARAVAPSEAIARRIAGRDESEPKTVTPGDGSESDEPRTMMLGPELVDRIDAELRERGL